ncbi:MULTISPECIES: hypothetical protein [unclassified Synechococcus]|uniref:hypothetical protein n=1 Tax=unclassified Synechococcus TaxID=2626047 RepID=UPI002AD56D79|nr:MULTISPECIES: hypothetical protein [unclassified Synechococcus]CAK6690456.1 hypothetical protein IFHNHDMJ_00819 [Synechococcus sp. CBW1107]
MNHKKHLVACSAIAIGLFLPLASYAIDPAYAKKLERSGCTQVTELQGCDINKTKAENAKAGFGTAPAAAASPYGGHWVAKNPGTGQTVANIRIDNKNQVFVNGKLVASKLSDGALVFKTGFITFTIQGDPRIANESSWFDSDAKTTGPIRRK